MRKNVRSIFASIWNSFAERVPTEKSKNKAQRANASERNLRGRERWREEQFFFETIIRSDVSDGDKRREGNRKEMKIEYLNLIRNGFSQLSIASTCRIFPFQGGRDFFYFFSLWLLHGFASEFYPAFNPLRILSNLRLRETKKILAVLLFAKRHLVKGLQCLAFIKKLIYSSVAREGKSNWRSSGTKRYLSAKISCLL